MSFWRANRRANLQVLGEIGIPPEEVKKNVVRNRWLLDYCRPKKHFFLKFAYFLKYHSLISLPVVIMGSEDLGIQFKKNLPTLLKVFYLSCEEEGTEFMRQNFETFLNIPSKYLSNHEYAVLIKTGMQSLPFLYTVLEIDMYAGEDEQIHFYLLKRGKCSALYLCVQGADRYLLCGKSIGKRDFLPLLEIFNKLANSVFSSSSWKAVSDFYETVKGKREKPTSILGISWEDYAFLEQIQRLHIATMKSQIVRNLPAYPSDLHNLIVSGYTKLANLFT